MGGTSDSHNRVSLPSRLATRLADGPARTVVVVGLDGSATSWDAFWWACGEARRLGGLAVAVFVSSGTAAMSPMAYDTVGLSACGYAEVERAAAEQARQLRAEVLAHTADDGPDVAFIHTRGDAAREILRVAEEVGADLIVVGRSTKARHHIAGSLGRCLIAKRRAPIVAVVP